MSDAEDLPPLLPTVAHERRLEEALRASLRVLRDQSDDPRLRERIDAVIAGRASLRDLARSGDFETLVAPYAERGYQQWDALDEEAREGLVDQALTDLDPWRPGA